MQRQLQLQYRGSRYGLSHNNSGFLPHTVSGVYRGLPIQIATAHSPIRQFHRIDLEAMTYRGVRLQAA